MKRLIFAVLTLACALFVAVPARAARWTGNDLLEKCQVALNADEAGHGTKNAQETMAVGWCNGFIMGATEQAMMQFNPATGQKNGPPIFCVPSSFNYGQELRLVVRWLNDHPESLHKSATYLVVQALQESYPCNNQ